MGRELVITVQGKDTRVTVRSLIEMLDRALGVLRELDARMSDNQRAGMNWEVVNVSMNSPLTMTLGPRIPQNRRDTSAEVVKSFLGGMRTLEKGANIPAHWNEGALEKLRSLVDLRNNGVASMAFSSQGEAAVEPTLHTAANIDEIRKKQHAHYWEETTIEGRLEVISAHNGTKLWIWDVLTNTKVECLVTDAQLEEAKGAFRKRVAVTGRAKVTRKGKPLEIEVASIRVLKEKNELPQAKDFEGTGRVDITGGVDSAEYIRSLRDAQ
jgi:hypothetical protein